jgi:hypothetical protein
VVSLNLPATSPRLVVQARIERLQVAPSGHQEIVLTTTAPYFSDRTAPAATGAIVRVTDDSGHVVAFVESSSAPGTYVTDQLLASVGRHYTLLIDYEGERYAAVDTLRAVAPIDTLYFEPRHPPDKNPALRATIDVTDPPQAGNDYLWDEYIDGVRARSPDSSAATRAVASDQFQNGTRVKEIQPYDGIPVLPGQLVTMRQMALSAQAFRFYSDLSNQASMVGSPLGVALANVRGNVANLTNQDHFALGYFIATEVAERSARCPVTGVTGAATRRPRE